MQQNIFEKIKNIPKFWWIFLVIVVIGIFLRTWHHHDWLRFNADQGRDAQIVSDVIEGKASLPLLGPKAGGTEFRLGPAFYWFEIAAAKIFGNAPDAMAYPDLAMGILCIPLIFLFLRKYFKKNQSLALTAVFAVSAYAIRYARFAWNPNSSPFWAILFLFALCEIFSEKENRKFFWSIVAGAAIGVGVQLHTTLLAILPATAVVVFGYFAFKNRNRKFLKYFLVVVVATILLNVPQLISEHQTGWKNAAYFSKGMEIKNKSERSVSRNAVQSASCWIQGNLDILSGYEISDTCEFDPSRDRKESAVFFLGLIFVLGGTILGLIYFLREKYADKKNFLGIFFAFTGIAYLIFFKFAFELSVRFYLPLVFLPLVLLGFWAKFIGEKFKIHRDTILLVAAVLLIFSNLFFVQKYFSTLANYGNPGGGGVNVMILEEAEVFSRFVVENSGGEKDAYIGGDGQFLFKGYKSIRYLAEKSNIRLSLLRKDSQAPGRYFFIASLKKREKMLSDENISVLGYKDFGSFSVLLVKNNILSQ